MKEGTQTGSSVDTKKVLGRVKRDKLVKVRMSPDEFYLLKKIDGKLGFDNVSTTIRQVLRDFEDIERSKLLVAAFKARNVAESELNAIVEGRQ